MGARSILTATYHYHNATVILIVLTISVKCTIYTNFCPSKHRHITIITREQAEKCIELISSVKDDIIASFPSTNTLRCRQGVAKDTHCITVLRQLLRYYNKRLISQRTKVPRTKGCKMHYTYKIAI